MAITPINLQSSLVSIHPAFADDSEQPARPFVKWVGGKGQLLSQIDANLPAQLRDGELTTYVEPFVGGGALFFHVAQHYPVAKFVLADNNADLILAYWTIRARVGQLITFLHDLQNKYTRLSEEKRQDYYYKMRDYFNEQKASINLRKYSESWVERTAQFIFLNKTCFNGLFRVNSSGLFNVAFGRYENPKISDPDNLVLVSRILQRAEILLGDFEDVLHYTPSDAFVYLDPPYRPLSETANFTAYSASTFTQLDQQRLANFCQTVDSKGAKLLISNSDPSNIDPKDNFFADTYPKFRIERAEANRMVNCKADRRGKISELLIMNY